MVSNFVSSATWWLGEAPITIPTLIRFYSRMCTFMLLAIWRPAKTLLTILALMRFHSCVYIFMCLTVWGAVKALITVLTLVRFSFVNNFMFFAKWWWAKALITILADIWLHLITGHDAASLITVHFDSPVPEDENDKHWIKWVVKIITTTYSVEYMYWKCHLPYGINKTGKATPCIFQICKSLS